MLPQMASISTSPWASVSLETQASSGTLRDRRVRATIWLTLIFWASNYFTLTLSIALSGNSHLRALAGVLMATTLLALFFCFLIHLLLQRLSSARKRLIALALVTPPAAEIFAWAVFFAEAAVDPTVSIHNFNWSNAVRTIALWTWVFLAWAGLYLALWYSFDAQEEHERVAELRDRAHAAQLRALHSQVNPHFLFNSLNSLSALVLARKIELAEEMVTKLAHFLRLGLAADPLAKIPLSTELELQRTYLSIEQLRYTDLEVIFDVSEDLGDPLVPSLILQPIIENAVKYGVASAPPPAWIRLVAWREAGILHFSVTDSGKGAAPKRRGAGIGLANVEQRLRLIYGEEDTLLDAARRPDRSFEVHLYFPLELP